MSDIPETCWAECFALSNRNLDNHISKEDLSSGEPVIEMIYAHVVASEVKFAVDWFSQNKVLDDDLKAQIRTNLTVKIDAHSNKVEFDVLPLQLTHFVKTRSRKIASFRYGRFSKIYLKNHFSDDLSRRVIERVIQHHYERYEFLTESSVRKRARYNHTGFSEEFDSLMSTRLPQEVVNSIRPFTTVNGLGFYSGGETRALKTLRQNYGDLASVQSPLEICNNLYEEQVELERLVARSVVAEKRPIITPFSTVKYAGTGIGLSEEIVYNFPAVACTPVSLGENVVVTVGCPTEYLPKVMESISSLQSQLDDIAKKYKSKLQKRSAKITSGKTITSGDNGLKELLILRPSIFGVGLDLDKTYSFIRDKINRP